MGNRRTGEALSPVPLTSAQAQGAFAEDDAMLTCPECGAGVRPEQDWCSLCLHVLRAPEPPPAPVVPAAPISAAAPDAVDAAPLAQPAVPADIEARADALLAQLAVDTRKDRLVVPSFLDSKAKVVVAIIVGTSVVSAAVLVILTVLGAVLR
jgi:rubredoxin